MILIDGGYIQNGKYYYYLTDHLGNNRVVADAKGIIIQKTHFEPFGKAFEEEEDEVKDEEGQPYLYNGKELYGKHGLDMYDYMARLYSVNDETFVMMDPLAEKYYSISPYVYVANNPLKFIDPTGMFIDDYFSPSGLFLGSDNSTTDNIRIMDEGQWNLNVDDAGMMDAELGQVIAPLHSVSGISSESSLAIYRHYTPNGIKVKEISKRSATMSYEVYTGGCTVIDESYQVNTALMNRRKFGDKVADVTNIFSHENKHYNDYRELGANTYHRLLNPKNEAGIQLMEKRAIQHQMNVPSWNSTSPALKDHIKSYANQLRVLFPGLNAPSLETPPILVAGCIYTILSSSRIPPHRWTCRQCSGCCR